jgi:hypothetical protein
MKIELRSIESLLRPQKGKSHLTKTYGHLHPGPYPVYSASLSGPLTHISTYDFEGRYLTWTANGYAGRVQVLEGRFSINSDRGLLISLDADLDLDYAALVLEPILRGLAIGRIVDGKRNEYTKLRWAAFAKELIPLPINDDGSLNRISQRKIAQRATTLKQLQSRAAGNLASIKDVLIDTEEIGAEYRCWRTVNLGDASLFSLKIGKRVLRKELKAEGIACYSSNVQTPFGMVEKSLAQTYSRDVLMWGIDGNFDWNLMPAGVPFCATDHCGILEVLDPKIEPRYLLYALTLSASSCGFDRTLRASLGRVADISVEIPIDDDGAFDVTAQRQIVRRHDNLERARRDIIRTMEAVVSAKLDADPLQLLSG